tara:strand:- start:268 stop:1320 length:1053 start_codon:yes stop_codon:yes gene_type:complete
MSLNKRLFTGGPLPGATLENAFQTVIWTGNGSTQDITGVGFQPDLVWIKHRDGTNPHGLWDSTRGAGKLLVANTTAVETGNSGNLLGSFDSDGFQVNRNYLVHTAHDNTNGNGNPLYVGWCWRANGGTTSTNNDGNITTTVQVNEDAGFSIIKTADSDFNQSRTFGHGLGNVGNGIPDLFIIKPLDLASEWRVYTSANSYAGFMILNSDAAQYNVTTNVTSSTFNTQWTPTGASYESEWIMYAFKAIPGFSKFGTYTGNATAGTNITVGFQPGWVLTKRTDTTDNWRMYDSVRQDSQPFDMPLYPNITEAETDNTTGVSGVTSTTFTLGNGNLSNANSATYIYMAFRLAP